jgi:hypothetical protein
MRKPGTRNHSALLSIKIKTACILKITGSFMLINLPQIIKLLRLLKYNKLLHLKRIA